MKKKIILLIVLIGITGFIYYMSDQPVVQSGEMSFGIDRWICSHFVEGFIQLTLQEQETMVLELDFWVRKSAHFVEYMMLGAVLMMAEQLFHNWCRASDCKGKSQNNRNRLKIGAIVAITVGSLYAVFDEIHQYFVPGRACQLRDMVIDICGVAAGVLMVFSVLWVRNQHIDRKQRVLKESKRSITGCL